MKKDEKTLKTKKNCNYTFFSIGSEKSKVSRNTGSKPQLQSSASNNVTSLPSANDSSAVSGVNSFSPKCVKSPETEAEEKRGSDGETGPKVPPLKIVIPSGKKIDRPKVKMCVKCV